MQDEREMIRMALLECGLVIESIYDLVNSQRRYPSAIPCLIKLLDADIQDERLVEGIIRSLAVREARGQAVGPLIHLYRKTPLTSETIRWVIGNSVEVTVTSEYYKDIAAIVSNPDNGKSRQMFVRALGKIRSPESEQLLITLLDDDEVVLHAIAGLSKLRSTKSKEKLSRLLQHPCSTVGAAARKALKKLGE